ncbi:sirohydrochlorin ferrochelatase [Kitasatospora sp. MAA4]|uniref:sirohydrochlorin chelatase n=1 Tax=Kitasatospora sp. MAA4 TaxID=3035093 RepID=UPI0024755F3B|nr:CbiX/SirB N-terminal domain-containing protein [Kitasatospora sp. MAA4]MDH6132666.1 sirohydrochlorin ferrochelatase [Kitasatospora sp. MAA4]
MTAPQPTMPRTTARRAQNAPTLLAVAHGTRDRAGAATAAAVLDRVRALRPGLRVEVGYLDLVRPSLDEALAALDGEVVLVPLLLGAGYHVRVDIPAAVAAAPRVRAGIAPALGPDPLLATALADRLAEAGRPPGDAPVVLAAAGSGDPAANADTARTARLLGARLGAPVVPAHLCGPSPTPAEAVAALRAEGHPQVSVARYLLAPGFFARRAADTAACLTSAPLGAHDAVARLVLRRFSTNA